jgi:hypothetical protein
MTKRILEIDLNQINNIEDVLKSFNEEKIPILETLMNIGLNYYIPEDQKDEIINTALENDELPPYFPESHREAIDLISIGMDKLNKEYERLEAKKEEERLK